MDQHHVELPQGQDRALEHDHIHLAHVHADGRPLLKCDQALGAEGKINLTPGRHASEARVYLRHVEVQGAGGEAFHLLAELEVHLVACLYQLALVLLLEDLVGVVGGARALLREVLREAAALREELQVLRRLLPHRHGIPQVEVDEHNQRSSLTRLEDRVLDLRIQHVDFLGAASDGEAEAVHVCLQGAHSAPRARANRRPHIDVPQDDGRPRGLQWDDGHRLTAPRTRRCLLHFLLLHLQSLLRVLETAHHGVQIVSMLAAESELLHVDPGGRRLGEVIGTLALARREEVDPKQLEVIQCGPGHILDGAHVERDQRTVHRNQQSIRRRVHVQAIWARLHGRQVCGRGICLVLDQRLRPRGPLLLLLDHAGEALAQLLQLFRTDPYLSFLDLGHVLHVLLCSRGPISEARADDPLGIHVRRRVRRRS
mmetsp:Transcript_34459/g.112157  ORF Transcript_34459/g.112157 Transcript_34459/m.112157 type:complete len:427 (-) Transcript_34459:3766-5046(-)